MSYFSGWGPSADMLFKPALSAPGGTFASHPTPIITNIPIQVRSPRRCHSILVHGLSIRVRTTAKGLQFAQIIHRYLNVDAIPRWCGCAPAKGKDPRTTDPFTSSSYSIRYTNLQQDECPARFTCLSGRWHCQRRRCPQGCYVNFTDRVTAE